MRFSLRPENWSLDVSNIKLECHPLSHDLHWIICKDYLDLMEGAWVHGLMTQRGIEWRRKIL